MSYPFTVGVRRLHYIYINRMVTVTRMWTTKRTVPGTVLELLLYRCNVAQGSRTVSGTIHCERKECTGLRACRVYTTTASLSGSSFRDALLELPVPEGVKTRVKEPEPLPSLIEIDFSHLD